jgi:hypothetical protein
VVVGQRGGMWLTMTTKIETRGLFVWILFPALAFGRNGSVSRRSLSGWLERTALSRDYGLRSVTKLVIFPGAHRYHENNVIISSSLLPLFSNEHGLHRRRSFFALPGDPSSSLSALPSSPYRLPAEAAVHKVGAFSVQ